MTRLLLAVIALSVLGYLAYRTMYGTGPTTVEPAAPTQQLQNVREKAKDIEVKDQQRADDVEKRMQE